MSIHNDIIMMSHQISSSSSERTSTLKISIGTETPSVRGNSRAATSRPPSSAALSLLVSDVSGVSTPNQVLFGPKMGDNGSCYSCYHFSSEKQFKIPVMTERNSDTVELLSGCETTEALPLRLSGDRSMRQVLRRSIWTEGGHGR